MGISGSLNNLFLNNFNYDNFFLTNYCINCLHSGVDFLYTYVEILYFYDFKVLYFWSLFSIFDESFDFFLQSYWFLNTTASTFNLVYSVILDTVTNSSIIKLYGGDEWYKNFLSSQNISLFLINHPELVIADLEKSNFLFLGNFFFSIYEKVDSEGFLLPVMLLPQLLILVFFGYLLVIFYLSYFTSLTKEEASADTDYLLMSASIESEKEIGSFDDIILVMVVLLYVFGWYFYVYCWSVLSYFPEVVFIFYLFPLLYYVIIGIPTYLSYDFGIFFLAYLRGVAPSPVLIMELMYDYIAFLAFYIRLLVQGVRLVLIVFTYASLHDYVIFFMFDQTLLLGNESIMECLNKNSFSVKGFSYVFFLVLPGKIFYWLYELFHTFFVVTAQTVAFFAMVFWLFLFLYTFFVFEKHENYFKEKRDLRRKIFFDLYNNKIPSDFK